MAGKKNNSVVAVFSELTTKQASKLVAEIHNAKIKCAPVARSTISLSLTENIGKRLQSGTRKALKEK